jgi:hypothetical protein
LVEQSKQVQGDIDQDMDESNLFAEINEYLDSDFMYGIAGEPD